MRVIRFTWWDQNHLLCNLFLGEGIHFHDLYVPEVQAMVDQLRFEDVEPRYRLPEAIQRRPAAWYVHAHHCRPGRTLQAFSDCSDDGERLVWDIHSGSCGVRITDEEAEILIANWEEFITGRKPEAAVKADWFGEGF